MLFNFIIKFLFCKQIDYHFVFYYNYLTFNICTGGGGRKKRMINTIEKQCCSCGACYNICPNNAISMEFSDKGFYSPVVNDEKCIKCGKCLNVCPAIEYKSKNTNSPPPSVYLVEDIDEERQKSTSGGAFGIFAKYVLANNGFVCGSAWNDNWEAEHIIIDNINDLDKLRISKYVQSNTKNCFSEIKKLLDNNKLVLFSGTPCQSAGLIKFLNKDYDNLITMDLLCHGAPSPKIWQDYLNKNYSKKDIKEIKFRNKSDWTLGTREAFYNTDHGYILENNKKREIGIFYEAFLDNILSCDSCMECKYKFVPRPADFTIGDFWYYRKYYPKINAKMGLSVLLANNLKAKRILKSVSKNINVLKPVNMKENWEHIEIRNHSKDTAERHIFFKKYLKGYDLNNILNEATHKHYDVGIISYFNWMNYGSALVSYAAYKIIEQLGYSILTVNKDFSFSDRYNKENRSLEFAKKHYNISRLYEAQEDCRELNDLCDTFIVTSDTQWWDSEPAGDFCWLDFVRSDKRKISFCTSFAHPEPAFDNNAIARRKYLFKRFHALSTREEQGVKILKDIFDTESEHLYDPTLLADKQIFEDLANQSSRTEKGFVFAYILDLTEEKEKIAKYIADTLNLKLKLISNMRYSGKCNLIDENNIAIEDFVYFCKNADFIFTDSFHGTCFSTIFEKPFISFANSPRGITRYKIFYDNNLKDYIFDNLEDVYNIDLQNIKPDFTVFNEKIKHEREKALLWLKQAMEKPLPKPSNDELLYDYLYNKNLDDKLNFRHKHNCCLKNIFSITNEYTNVKRKIVNIFGIKIKFKIK